MGEPPARRRPLQSQRQCRGAAVQRSDGETSSSRRRSQSSRTSPERMIVIELAADLICSICDAYRR